MIEPSNPILSKMLERLFASMVNGPAMNCRPHASRQRVDVASLSRLKDVEPAKALLALVGPDRTAKLTARAPVAAKAATGRRSESRDDDEEELSPQDRAARQAYSEQQTLLTKLRVIADDARTYEQDTGVHALNIGFPLLSLPPGSFGGRAGVASRRVLAPIAFIPATLTIKSGAKQVIELAAHGEGVDLVIPNVALFSWLEQQTGQPFVNPFEDADAANPWREIAELVRIVAQRIEFPVPAMFTTDEPPADFAIAPTPKADDSEQGPTILASAVLGLFPTSNQGLLKDTKEMIASGAPDGPLDSFVRHGVSLELPPPAPVVAPDAESIDADAESTSNEAPPVEPEPPPVKEPVEPGIRTFTDERLVSVADPCQARAVRMSRKSRGLVVHGPPGTGKSQTIANVIGDHLARGERVLFVCDKRTALDVVADRLNALGLANLCATVHDPQRDQREFYRSVREQLDNLPDTSVKSIAAGKLAKIDAELQTLHDDLSQYYRSVMGDQGGVGSFHWLVGQWLSETGDAGNAADWDGLQKLQASDFERHKLRLKETLERGEAVEFAKNPWKDAAGMELGAFLSHPMDTYRTKVETCRAVAGDVDATADPLHPAFDVESDLKIEAEHRRKISAELEALQSAPMSAAQHWVKQPRPVIEAAIAELAAAADAVAEVKSGPVDSSLRPASLASAEALAADRKALEQYVAGFDARAAKFSAIRTAATGADDDIILTWMAADPKTAATARKRLDSAAPIAQSVRAGELDASLLSRFETAPFDSSKIFEALASLSAYLDIADKWTAVFQGGKKKAAEPFVRHFGLSLSSDAALRVKQFLADFQQRSDLRAALDAATGKPFAERPNDEELLSAFHAHRGVLTALSGEPSAPKSAAAPSEEPLGDAVVGALNALVGEPARRANEVVGRHALPTTPANAGRLIDFLRGLEARVTLAALLTRMSVQPPPTAETPDGELLGLVATVQRMLDLLLRVPPGTALGNTVARALTDRTAAPAIVTALTRSPQRAAAVLKAEQHLTECGLYSNRYLKAARNALRAGKLLTRPVESLGEKLDTLENVIRVKEGLSGLPAELSAAASGLLSSSCAAATGFSAIRRNVLAGEIIRRLRADPNLQTVDGHRLRTSFERYRELSNSKREVVRDVILSHWIGRQKERLLASTGSRLNSFGADLRRRLTTRGERAMRLRQVISHGAAVEGGDPLFDLRPVWMASPETVAQLFPREPIFDVVVFDEASQCRLEEAMPVLTRASRVVIAGDPKQLPPTRFFESAVSTSEQLDAESEQELFESHQGEVEDLLAAALGLDVDQCYLDVHYRSRNADLIGFSNEHFYGSRLQAIPGHPRNRTRYAPITLYRAEGTYEKRRNPIEADAVCKIVRDLLKRAAPPSIGIACFNLVQRDLIVEKLEEMAEEDSEFASKLAEARERRGPSSSEGLFVKNLENVQGDERDHLIISTTYGPDPAGKFRRSFGPLGTAGGGRRLNVLVTRARDELHVVTSIPRSAYTNLPEIPAGTAPSGAWLLFAYLLFAEKLQEEYELNHRILESTEPAERASVSTRPTQTPSTFAKALAQKLATEKNHGSEVHWGNEGFNVDVAVQHPSRAEDVTIGVLCDMTRFGGSDDPVEWDVFRTSIHESQGWKLHRVWSPHFFRDPAGSLKEIDASVQAAIKAEDGKR